MQGIKNLNHYYNEKELKEFENLRLISKKNATSLKAFCPIILGISFLDQVKSLESFDVIQFDKIAYPLIFLAFLSRASEVSGKKIHIKIDQNEILLNLNVNIFSNFFNLQFPVISKNIELKFVDNQDNFTDLEWNSLYKLAEDTFVEESESSKKGAAGAGLTDND